jgi:hypothetical protein
MNRSRFNNCGSAACLVALTVVGWAGATGSGFLTAQASPGTPQKLQGSLLEQAAQAERELRFDVAADRLYRILLDRPHTPDAASARMALGRLLALSGDAAAALLQYQSLRDDLPADDPLRKTELDLATTLARRLRAAANASFFRGPNPVMAKGVGAMNEPTNVAFQATGAFLLVDAGKGLAYHAEGGTASVVPDVQDVTAAAFLPDGRVAVAGKGGLSITGGKPVIFTGTWGGQAHQVKKVRALAATTAGELLAVDRDYEGVLKCRLAEATCGPWGPPGKVRTVKVGVSGFVYLLDDNQQSVRVVDPAGRLIVAIGPVLGPTKLDEVVDIAVDAFYGIYLLDRQLRRVQIVVLKSGASNQVTAELLGSVGLDAEGDRPIRNPSAIGLTPDGALLVAGRSMSRLFRFE